LDSFDNSAEESSIIDSSFISQSSFFNNSHDLSQEIFNHIHNNNLNRLKQKELTSKLMSRILNEVPQKPFIEHVKTQNSIIE
jgi:hypothetical protein